MTQDSEAWKSRQHDVTTSRTRKGRTTQRVTRFGAASVVGALDVDIDGRPLLSTSPRDEHVIHPSSAAARLLVKAAERGELRKRRHGLATLDVERICRDAYGDLIPPVLTGTEVRQFEQVIHRDRAASSAVTSHSVGLDGGRNVELSTMWISGYMDAQGAQTARVVRDDTIGAIVEQDPANVPQTESSITWPARGTSGTMQHGRLAHEPRTTDPRTRRVFRVASDGTCERVVIVVTGHADDGQLWDGHVLRERQAAQVKSTDKRKARTVEVDAVPTVRDAWETLISRLEPNGRADLGDITITRTAKGDYYCATIRADGASTRERARTPRGLALKLPIA